MLSANPLRALDPVRRAKLSLRISLIGPLTLAFLLLGAIRPSYADGIALEVMGGSAVNFPSSLVVRQYGFPAIRVSGASYETRPFGPDFPYYAWRLSYWRGTGAWELEHIHHRLFLTNPPPEIEFFAVHFGYNYLLLGRAWKHNGFVYRIGAGPIVTNPESTVRGRRFRSASSFLDVSNGFSGIGTRVAVGRDLHLTDHFYLLGEASFTAGFAWRVPVADGSANVPNRALHGHLGVGVNF